jgi:translation elongation factor EF-1beta
MSDKFNVSLTLKIYLEDYSKIEDVKKNISAKYKVSRFWEEDIGFGIKALKASLLLIDGKGGADEVEEYVMSVDGVSQVQVEDMSRI